MDIEYALKFNGSDDSVHAMLQPQRKPELPDATTLQSSLEELTKQLASLEQLYECHEDLQIHNTQGEPMLVDGAKGSDGTIVWVPAIIVEKKATCSGVAL